MSVALTHTTVATGTDAGNAQIGKAQWNETHTLTMATDRLLGRTTAGAGAVEEISVGSGLSLSAGSIAVSSISVAQGGTGQTSYTDGQLLIGNSTGNTLTKATLTAGSGISITNGAGSITIASTGGSGTVTSVAQTFTGGLISVSGSPVTTSGTLALTVAGTSGGIPYFSGASTWASSAALTANALMIGGGAGVAPSTITTGTGVVTALGVNVGSSGAFTTNNAANTFTAAQTFRAANSVRAEAASTQDAVVLAGRAGGTNSYAVTFTPTTLSASRTITLPDAAGVAVLDTATQTLTNKTFTGFIETVFTITDGASVDIDPVNGTIQLWTLGASRTPTATNFSAGESVTLMILDGTAFTITWTTIAVTWTGSGAPTLDTTKYTVIELWKVGSVVYGALVGYA